MGKGKGAIDYWCFREGDWEISKIWIYIAKHYSKRMDDVVIFSMLCFLWMVTKMMFPNIQIFKFPIFLIAHAIWGNLHVDNYPLQLMARNASLIVLVAKRRFLVADLGDLVLKNLRLTTKMIYLCIFLPQIAMDKLLRMVEWTSFLLVHVVVTFGWPRNVAKCLLDNVHIFTT